jgi:hypothetical protein
MTNSSFDRFLGLRPCRSGASCVVLYCCCCDDGKEKLSWHTGGVRKSKGGWQCGSLGGKAADGGH